MVSRQCAFFCAYAAPRWTGMICRTNRKETASHPCASECECCKKKVFQFINHSKRLFGQEKNRTNLTSTAKIRRKIYRNAGIDSPSFWSTGQCARANVRANYRCVWISFHTRDKESLISARIYRSRCISNADPNDTFVWSLCHNYGTRMVCPNRATPNECPGCPDWDRRHCSCRKENPCWPNAMCTNDGPDWCAIWMIWDRNRILCGHTENDRVCIRIKIRIDISPINNIYW